MIKRIQLENFKKFTRLDLELNKNDISILSGTNNSGKTSILHALAVWEYAKILLINYRGRISLNQTHMNRGKGFGISPSDFSPIELPSLRYLWYDQNTMGSYRMKIKLFWDSNIKNDAFLEIAFTLNGNNFAIKNSDSNLVDNETIPTIAYLPPFAGISSHESWVSLADRRSLIGKGLAGAVIRNILIDLHDKHEEIIAKNRFELFGNKQRLTRANNDQLSSIVTEWRVLKSILAKRFKIKLLVQSFDKQFHNYINIELADLDQNGNVDNQSKRDIMMEGSGFLQWLSVFTFAVDQSNDILLLDEPDAHLHSSLQSVMVNLLDDIATKTNKQILLVSHSSELIKNFNYNKIISIREETGYLQSDIEKVSLLEGLGSKYFPLLDQIVEHRRILFVENNSDTRALKAMCKALGKEWPENLVEWVCNKKHDERKHLIIELNKQHFQQVGEPIKAFSLRDLDDENTNNVNMNLVPNGRADQRDDSGQHIIMLYRTLRRRELENYLIIPSAISRYILSNDRNQAIAKDENAVNDYLREKHGLVVGPNYKNSEILPELQSLFRNDLKLVLNGINSHFKVKFCKDDYIEQITANEICDDIIKIIDELILICNQ